MQRVVTDFGAERAFGRVPMQLQEHYGLTLASSTIQRIVEDHAQCLHETLERAQEIPETAGVDTLIVEADGSMIPIVETDCEAVDRRKQKRLSWKEARLCLAHEPGANSPTFATSFQESVEHAGTALFDCACRAGFGCQTAVHAVGDGAPWIRDQVEQQFGAQARYLIDFYHACDYLSQAAAPLGGEQWFQTHKTLLKEGKVNEVIDALQPVLEAPDTPHAPIRACYRYLRNRPEQFDYPHAKAHGLPIGSGEIESAHRYVIQERLKVAGAWWSPTRAKHMLSMREVRANQQWNAYWQQSIS